MNRKLLITGAIFGLLAVILGAFATHGLKDQISSDAMRSFETGVRYQMYHALLLLIVANIPSMRAKTKRLCLVLVICGVILFSGSIYGLATNELSAFDFKRIALITPIGGTLLIISWLLLLIDFLRFKRD